MSLLWVLAATTLVSLMALVGGGVLVLSGRHLDRLLPGVVAFAAGTLLGGAFLHLLPESVADLGEGTWVVALVGFSAFFALEDLVDWHHHHETDHAVESVSTLVLISDALHNFVDGVVIGGAFVVSLPLGVVTTGVIAVHELPQEIGDVGILIQSGLSHRRALGLNFLVQTTAVAGGVTGFALAGAAERIAPLVLAFAAGAFVYIASSDLVPEIKRHTGRGRSALYFVTFVVGLVVMYVLTFFEPPV